MSKISGSRAATQAMNRWKHMVANATILILMIENGKTLCHYSPTSLRDFQL
jgi:hypothetical protein